MAVTQGERIPGGFILITGLGGIRYAVPQSVGIIHDTDECRDKAIVQLNGRNRAGYRLRSTRF